MCSEKIGSGRKASNREGQVKAQGYRAGNFEPRAALETRGLGTGARPARQEAEKMQAFVRRLEAGPRLSASARQRIAKARAKLPSVVNRLFHRNKLTLFQRCLAVHIISASETSLLR
jgi:hypothetical protein